MTLNGPSGMYKIKPYYEKFKKIELPNCMYNLRNLHASEVLEKKEISDPYQVLAKRQETIINHLEELKSQVLKIKQELGVSKCDENETKTLRTESISLPLSSELPLDIVISASPLNPPLSLWVLRNMLQDMNLKVSLSTHTHSSVADIPENIKQLPYDILDKRMETQVKFTVIWKNVDVDPELMVNPLIQNVIQGEANALRFIARLVLPGFNDLDPVTATELDCWLDKSYFSLLRGNNKERQSFLRQMNAHLGKSEFLVGKSFTIADIAIWSAILQVQLEKTLPSNVAAWLKKLASQTAFSHVNY